MALRKHSPAAGEFLFEIDPEPLQECVTALGGIPLLARAPRSLHVTGSVQRHLQVKQRERGLDQPTYDESLPAVNAHGGDCSEAFDQWRADAWLSQRLGPPGTRAEAART